MQWKKDEKLRYQRPNRKCAAKMVKSKKESEAELANDRGAGEQGFFVNT